MILADETGLVTAMIWDQYRWYRLRVYLYQNSDITQVIVGDRLIRLEEDMGTLESVGHDHLGIGLDLGVDVLFDVVFR